MQFFYLIREISSVVAGFASCDNVRIDHLAGEPVVRNIAYIAFAMLGLIWGTNFIFMKWAAVLITPGQIVLLRVLFGFLPILAFALLSRSLRWAHLRHAHHFLVMSLLATAIYYYAYAKGTSLLYSGVAGMLSGAIPLFSFVAAFLFLRQEPLNPRTTAGVLVGFLGILLIARPWSGPAGEVDLEGVAYMLIGSMSLGFSFVYARRFLAPLEIPAAALSTWQTGFALVPILLLTDLQGITAIATDTGTLMGLVLGLGMAGTGIAFILYYLIVQRLGALVASSVTYIPPLVALLIGWFLANEPMHILDLAAVAVILGGVYLLQTRQASVARQATVGAARLDLPAAVDRRQAV